MTQNDAENAEAKIGVVVSKTISLQTTHDPDAEDENVVLNVTATGGLTPTIEAKSIEIDDDETQTYVFKVTTDKPKEGSPINVTLRADPAHVNDSLALTLHSSNPKYGHDQTADGRHHQLQYTPGRRADCGHTAHERRQPRRGLVYADRVFWSGGELDGAGLGHDRRGGHQRAARGRGDGGRQGRDDP